MREDIIYCDSLVKIYDSEDLKVMALQGLDMSIKRGEMIAVIGKSGSGKSTLLNIIGGLEIPTAGQIFVEEKDLSRMGEEEMVEYRKNTVGFVWQKSSRNLFSYMTALENVEAPMHFSKIKRADKRKRALKLLLDVGMEKHANKYPPQLSGGEQQRIAIAVALANNPFILLADEPTGAVDTKTANEILRLFHKLNEEHGLTIIIVTHDIQLADMVHRTVMISDGKISTEKVRKGKMNLDMLKAEFTYKDSKEENMHEIYSVLDKAHRLKLDDEIREKAGIDSNKVKVEIVDGKIVISKCSEQLQKGEILDDDK